MSKDEGDRMGSITLLWILGAIFLLIGLILKYGAKWPSGMALIFLGILWIIVLLGYQVLTAAGIYGKQPQEIGYATNIISAVIIIIGLIVGYTAVKKAKR